MTTPTLSSMLSTSQTHVWLDKVVKAKAAEELRVVEQATGTLKRLVDLSYTRRMTNPGAVLSDSDAMEFETAAGTLLAIVGYDEYHRIMGQINPMPL